MSSSRRPADARATDHEAVGKLLVGETLLDAGLENSNPDVSGYWSGHASRSSFAQAALARLRNVDPAHRGRLADEVFLHAVAFKAASGVHAQLEFDETLDVEAGTGVTNVTRRGVR